MSAIIAVEERRRVRITLDLEEQDAFNLWAAISEAVGYVDNWRSDATLLAQLRDELHHRVAPAGAPPS